MVGHTQPSLVLVPYMNYYMDSDRGGGGAGTAIMEAKLEQKLTGIVHEPLFQFFLDVRKAYDSLE